MKIVGKVHAKCDVVSGQKNDGSFWNKQTLVVETVNDNPKKMAIDFFGDDKVESLKSLAVGQMVEVVFVPESREHDGKWYTNLSGIAVRAYA